MPKQRSVGNVNEARVDMVHTIYMTKTDWDDVNKIAQAKNLRGASALVRDLIQPLLDEYRGGAMKKEVNVEVKRQQRYIAKRKEDQYYSLLEKDTVSRCRNAYSALRKFAVRMGTDITLTDDIEEVLKKLKLYDYTGSELFSEQALINFIMYLEALIARRKLDEEIKQCWRQQVQVEEAVVIST